MCEKGKFIMLGSCTMHSSRYGNWIDADIHMDIDRDQGRYGYDCEHNKHIDK